MSHSCKKCRKREKCCIVDCHRSTPKPEKGPVYGEFIRTFVFSEQPQLPIVQPGGNIVFPIPTVLPRGVRYVDEPNRVGVLVPQGVYSVSWRLNPGIGSTVNLLVNGISPLTPTSFPYTSLVTTDIIDTFYLVNAPLVNDNLISLVNGGTSLFTLNDLPNTRIDDTAILTYVRVERV